MIVGRVVDAKIEGFEMEKQVFRFIFVAKYEISVLREKTSKTRGKRDPKMIPKSSFGRSGD